MRFKNRLDARKRERGAVVRNDDNVYVRLHFFLQTLKTWKAKLRISAEKAVKSRKKAVFSRSYE
jgi:hypothetical protein